MANQLQDLMPQVEAARKRVAEADCIKWLEHVREREPHKTPT